MNSGNQPTTATNIGLSAATDEQRPSVWWLCMATLAFSALTVPYATYMIQWANSNGLFPLRPAIYLAAASVGCILVTLGRRPDLTVTTMLILLFHVFYIFESTVLQRYDHPSGRYYPLMTHGALLVSVFSIAWFLGVTHRLSSLPVTIASAAIVIICSLANIAEWFGVHEFTIVTGRAAGFHGDPNNAAIAIVLALAVFLTYNRNIWVSFGMMALSFIAVAITLSRSGMIAEVLISVSYLVVSYRRKPTAVLQALAVTVPVVVAGIVYLVSHMSSEALRQSDIQDRLGALMGKDSEKMASGERMKDLTDGLNAVREQPVMGHGVGTGTGKWQPHNQLVAVWIDGGVVFAGLYLIILGSMAVKCVAAGGRGGLCLLAVGIFIPFSQLLHTSLAYWTTCIIMINLTSKRFIMLQWSRPDESELLENTQPLTSKVQLSTSTTQAERA
ncbi:hypothetical protein NT6N_03500 [Oceaniferula spumae]|uniref:O-antigen ligase-related domain-containing protein n=1 Tax=Oceaniferula spumae TaxID=2979115 RepID=A0AAT9FH54_9BACT